MPEFSLIKLNKTKQNPDQKQSLIYLHKSQHSQYSAKSEWVGV